MNIKAFVAAARKGVVTIEFTKIDTGDKRVMPCTLNEKLAPKVKAVNSADQENMEHLVVWSMDKDAWRSFRVSTVTDWYESEYEPKQETSNQGSDS